MENPGGGGFRLVGSPRDMDILAVARWAGPYGRAPAVPRPLSSAIRGRGRATAPARPGRSATGPISCDGPTAAWRRRREAASRHDTDEPVRNPLPSVPAH